MVLKQIYNKETKRIIINWFNKGKDEINYFDKFIYLWISFNAFYCGITLDIEKKKGKSDSYSKFLCENERLDGDMNKVLFFADVNQKIFVEFIKDNEYINIYFEFILKREHPNHPKKDKGGVVRLDEPKKIIRYKKNDDLKDFISLIYQIRSNLFHGGKDTYSENSKELIEKTNLIFESFLNYLYDLKK